MAPTSSSTSPAAAVRASSPACSFPKACRPSAAEVEVDIEGYDSSNGLLRLTRLGQAQAVTNWSSVNLGMTVEARVMETNKGGLSVEVNGIRGFMPFPRDRPLPRRATGAVINQKLICEVIELDPSERNLVVSRRALMERERETPARGVLEADPDRGRAHRHGSRHQAVRRVSSTSAALTA